VKLALIVAVLAIAAPARADTDWARGVITTSAVGTADRRAPSPAVARVGALREAEARAAASLLEQARALPRASGGTVGEAADADPAVAAALAAALAVPLELATDRQPDGSVRIERALPIEAVRQAMSGPEPVAGVAPEGAVTAIVVDARNLKVTPAVGIGVSDGTETLELPVLFRGKAPKLDGAVKAKAGKYSGGALVIDKLDLAALRTPGVLLIVVIREKT
jgi:hypothetical protein